MRRFGGCQRKQLPFPAGQREDVAIEDGIQMIFCADLLQPPFHILPRQAVIFHAKSISARLLSEKTGCGSLEYRSHVNIDLHHGVFSAALAAHPEHTGKYAFLEIRDQTAEAAEQRRFATAAVARQQDHFAGKDWKTDTIYVLIFIIRIVKV